MPFENVTYESLADIGSAAFVAQNVAEGRDARVEVASVVVAGVAACAEDADDAWLPSTQSTCSTEHVAFDVDAGSGADGGSQGCGHDGGFLRGATSTIEVNLLDGCRFFAECREKFVLQDGTDGSFVLLEGVDALGRDDA